MLDRVPIFVEAIQNRRISVCPIAFSYAALCAAVKIGRHDKQVRIGRALHQDEELDQRFAPNNQQFRNSSENLDCMQIISHGRSPPRITG